MWPAGSVDVARQAGDPMGAAFSSSKKTEGFSRQDDTGGGAADARKLPDLSNLRNLLIATRMKDLVSGNQDVVTLEHDSSVGHALRVLGKHRILSAPMVIKPGLEDVENGMAVERGPTLVDWVDVNDILREFLAHLRARVEPLPTSMLQLMGLLEKEGPGFTDKSLITIVGDTDHALVFQPDADTSVLAAIKDMFLAIKTQRINNVDVPRVVHRLAMFDPYGYIVNIVSQMDVVRYLHEQAAALGRVADMSIEELGLLEGKPPVLTVDPTMPAILAYDRLQAAGIRGAAVVSPEGALIANISVSDLRAIQPEHLGQLALPVAEFLALLHSTAYLGYSQRTSHSAHHPFFAPESPSAKLPRGRSGKSLIHDPVVCTAATSLRELLALLVENHVHRVYVMDRLGDRHGLRSVITLTDILALVGRAL